MKSYMYILLCGDGSYYTGSTTNLELRLDEHKRGEGANHTRKHLPVKLVYFEEFSRIDDAFYREKQIQGWSRSKKEALIKGDSNKLRELSKSHSQKITSTGTVKEQSEIETTLPSTGSGTGNIDTDATVPSTGSGTGIIDIDSTLPSTGSGTAVTNDSDFANPVAEPVEATVSPTILSSAEPVEAEAEATPFTIGTLINELKKYPEDILVLTDGYEGDYENILQPKLIRVMQIPNQPYYCGQYHISEEEESFDALVIKREVRPF
jgi:putative endonuclease